MAQSKVTEFFSTRKRSSDIQPSKRRKIQKTVEFDVSSVLFGTEKQKLAKGDTTSEEITLTINEESVEQNLKVPDTKQSNVAKAEIKTRRSTRSRGKGKVIVDNALAPTIQNAFDRVTKASTILETVPEETTDTVITEDRHDIAVPITPTKRHGHGFNNPVRSKRVRNARRKDLLAEEAQTSCTEESLETPLQKTHNERQLVSARKRLIIELHSSPESASNEIRDEGKDKASKHITPPGSPKASNKTITPQADQSTSCVSSPQTPLLNKVKTVLSQKSASPSSVTKAKELEKLGPKEVREKLAKCGQLSELKAKLVEINKLKINLDESKKTAKTMKVVTELKAEDKKTKSTTPAYERFHALAQPGPPTLTLPYKFRMLTEMFRSADTIVSMLHNRSEVCTFDKLKSAIQEMVRKSFELKHLGQIKAVYPTAYNMRQEKNIPQFGLGKKSNSYQLTVEPNLTECTPGNVTDKNEKLTFTATHLVSRRHFFQNSLLSIVKENHKMFLAKLPTPITVPDEKVTRWHPKFNVDDVPSITPAEIPLPPVVKTLTSAKDVLAHARCTFPTRVEKALQNVTAKSSPSKEEKIRQNNSPVAHAMKIEKSYSNQAPPPIKGIPGSLLERIRAKEAKKMADSLTCNPEDDKRLQMLARLPDIARILRTYFVTEKKNALAEDLVVQKVVESYKSALGVVEAHAHLVLLRELVPNWLSSVCIRKGHFLKLNKETDLNDVTNRLKGALKNKAYY